MPAPQIARALQQLAGPGGSLTGTHDLEPYQADAI